MAPFVTVLMALSLVGCKKTEVQADPGRIVLVSIDGDFLYEDQLLSVMPTNLSEEDSALFVQRYIRNWTSDVLLYNNAQRNIADSKEIDALVENYRKALVVQKYERSLMDEKLSKVITAQEVETFYKENSSLFILKEPIIKGLLLKIPISAPNLNKMKELYRKTDDASFDEIEKYGVRYAVRYEFFYDNWVKVSDIETILPRSKEPLEKVLASKDHLEIKDDEFIYLLNVSEFVARGSIQPLEQANDEIRRLLINSRQVEFIQQIKDELYEDALERGTIRFNKDSEE